MNSPTASILLARFARIIAALCAGISLISTVPAQPVANTVSSRYLFIFDTSSAMKKRVPAMQSAVERLFFSMMNGHMQPGDTIGVWAFDRKLRAGEFPLQHWMPQNAAVIASNITDFVEHQHYSKSTRFDVVMPDINNLVQNSERLTMLIFCDGDGEIEGTPFDKPINSVLKQNERELGKANQAFIVVLRSQFGQYTGYTVNSSAIGVNFPEFPPLPAPPQPALPPKANPPPVKVEFNPPSVVQMPPLVIIGTNVGTNLIPRLPPKMALTNPPPTTVVVNPPPPVAALTNSSTNSVPPPATKMQTNTPAPPEENPSGLSRNSALVIGAAMLVVAVLLIIFAVFRSRKAGRGSLISRAMKKD